ncbi:Glu-tRNA(Gln) amidotransferase subunit GatE [Candidatus Woesearchaeota archaeon]|nr:Glu-tRNA(Gln) amidotransferase subunit GatE [Candidatus Woesearchaeota archaeon]
MQLDYKSLEFKCGLELHQQIGANKLFCKCPSAAIEKLPDYAIKRRLRAVSGETGEIDVAAKFETEKSKYFLYEGNSKNTCLVELDESPPYPINNQALEIALKVALLLNAKIIDEIQIMRKIVVDGSNVCGFQRTALIATNGFIGTSLGKVNIQTICLEEEAAQKIEETNDFVRYNLNRLGISLIEIATDSSIKNPEHAKEIASYLGMVLRSVEGIKRGLGTIRQDVNISIKNAQRTEIKGFQDLKNIPNVIEYEVKRQLNAISHGKKLEREVRKAEPNLTTTFLRPMPGAARLYPETDIAPIKIDERYVNELMKNLPNLISHKLDDFEKKYNINKELAKELVNNKVFEQFVDKFSNIQPVTIANTLITMPKEIKARFKLEPSNLADKDFEEVLGYLNEGKIAKEAVIELLVKKIKSEKISLENFAISDADLEKEIKALIEDKKGLNISAYMGILMKKYRGKVDGKKIMEILSKHKNPSLSIK